MEMKKKISEQNPKQIQFKQQKKSTEKRDIDVTVSSKSTSIREVNEPEEVGSFATSVGCSTGGTFLSVVVKLVTSWFVSIFTDSKKPASSKLFCGSSVEIISVSTKESGRCVV